MTHLTNLKTYREGEDSMATTRDTNMQKANRDRDRLVFLFFQAKSLASSGDLSSVCIPASTSVIYSCLNQRGTK